MQKILVPVDFSDLSNFALSVAKEIATGLNAELICLNVVHVGKSALFDSHGNLSDSNDFDVNAINQLKAENEAKIKEFTKYIPDIRTVVKIGDIEEVMLHCERDENISMIIMGTHGSEGLKQQISGTIADKIIRLAKASVLTLKCPREISEFKDIILASEFDPPVKDNITELKELANIFGAKLHLLKVNTPFNKDKEEVVQARMEQYCEFNELENTEFHTIEASSVEAGIKTFAEKNNYHFVAIGSRGRMGISAFFNGCVSADLVNHLQMPVFTFRA